MGHHEPGEAEDGVADRYQPPGRGPHTVSPIVYEEVPNFKGPDGLPRTYAFITDEAAGAADMKPCASGIRTKAYMVDITDETHPFPVSTWQVPVGNFCEKGGRFGPHQHAETVNGEINRFEDKLAWVAYFNAGVRVVDLSDPYNLKEVGYYMPKTNALSHPITKGQPHGDPDQRRGHRSSRAGLRVGPRRLGPVRLRIHGEQVAGRLAALFSPMRPLPC